jgi:hypothetical protein
VGRAWQRGRREEGNSEQDTLRPVRFIGIVPFRVDLFALVLNPAHSKIVVRLGKGSERVCDNPPRKISYYHLNQSTLVIKR